jgi:tetratricopeptide (TPR) repeat protein
MSLQAAYDQTRRWIESNDSERAIGLAQHILNHYPENLEAYRILGEAYLASRQLDRSQDSFERVLRSDPENIPAHVGLGITFERQGKLDRAVPEFEQAWEIKPDMAELRSQLLRLYADAWGSENAQLRLSRAGLARLYAKGHMLPQAISEFRQVIAEQPHRADAKVALAEALWRNNQEEDAAELCRELLEGTPQSLKANLILGYLQLASGNPDGQHYWETARRMDPYYTVARAMFETLPVEGEEEPSVEEWDEADWRASQQHEDAQPVAATRPMPVATTIPPMEDSAFSPGSWFGAADEPSSAGQTFGEPDINDDFLANLLSLGPTAEPDLPPASPNTQRLPELADDFQNEQLGAIAKDDTSSMKPFSLQELGLTDEDILSLEDTPTSPSTTSQTSANEQMPAEPTSVATGSETDEATFTPFSLADLGLTDEEIASLENIAASQDVEPSLGAEQPGSTSPVEDETQLTPFSLADLGLSEEEIASLNTLNIEDDTSTSQQSPAPQWSLPEEDQQLTPFSLADLGLSEEEIASLNTLSPDLNATPNAQPGGNQGDEVVDFDDFSMDLKPFSLDELDLASTPDLGDVSPNTQPFSLNDFSTGQSSASPADQSSSGVAESGSTDEDFLQQLSGYSWQQPTQRGRPSFLKSQEEASQEEGMSIFAKLKQRKQSEAMGVTEQPSQPPPLSQEPADSTMLFSFDDISLRDDVPSSRPDQSSDKPLDATVDAAASGSSAPAPESPGIDAQSSPNAGNVDDDFSIEQMQPFSLADLGLSDEEIASLNLNDTESQPSHQTSPLDFSTSQDTTSSEAPGTTFEESLIADDFDLSPAFDPTQGDIQEAPAGITAEDEPLITSDLKPFSLADLGLSDEEIAALGLGPTVETDDVEEESGLGITEEELAGLNLGDLDWAQVAPSEPLTDRSFAAPESDVDGFDPVMNHLMELGRRQGYVDISDIIANVQDPEAEAERIEQIGRLLHEANIQIRDGDEIIDMDAEYAEDDVAADGAFTPTGDVSSAPAERSSDDLSDMTPFSLSELGLSEEEIASFGLVDTGAETPPSPAQSDDTLELTPFSLSELGLSDEEIVSLGLAETSGETNRPGSIAPANTPTLSDDTPDLTPFSLSELGLSEEEIASLHVGESETGAAETPTPVDETPDLTPFSLSELGLSEDEISSLNLGETGTTFDETTTPSDDTPDLTPFSLSELGLSEEEISSLNLGESETGGSETPAPTDDTPDMTPFSLSELGLSEEEIAALGLAETGPGSGETTTPIDTPDLTPSSLSELGLSEEEIASFDLPDTSTTMSPAQQEAPFGISFGEDENVLSTPSDQTTAEASDANMMSFSLSELGLSEEEISSLSFAETSETFVDAPQDAPDTTDSPNTTPFSLTDLGLSDEEITALSSLGTDTPVPETLQPAPTEPLFVAQPPTPTPPARSVEPPFSQEPPAPPAEQRPTSTMGSFGLPTWMQGGSTGSSVSSNPVLVNYMRRLESDPNNHILRLSIARISGQTGVTDQAIQQYRQLIKQNVLIDDVIDDLRDWIADSDDLRTLQRLHRTLGDAYTKQGRFEEAMEEYSWTLGAHSR